MQKQPSVWGAQAAAKRPLTTGKTGANLQKTKKKRYIG